MFKVYENDKPAAYPHVNIHSSWNQYEFETFKEAKNYADKYLGLYGPFPFDGPGAYDFSGFGCILEIKEEYQN